MDAAEFRKRGREMVDYIADYMTQIRSRRVTPEVEPGYLRHLLPSTAPKKGEEWDSIMDDVEKAILPGITHWQHPNFHAYFPAGNSYPSILGDMLSDALGCIGFSWAASPACAELETLVLDWVGKMIGLPKQFLHTSGEGGGVIQGSASESVLVALLSARHKTIKQLKEKQPFVEEDQLLSRLVGYCSKMAHSCVEKAGMIGFVKMRQLDVDEDFSLRGHVLEDAIEEDKRMGLIPFFVCATLGTTACCSFDALSEIGDVTRRHGIYLHVDAAYAGNALICPEFQYLSEGIEDVNSFSFNTNKWLQVNFDCSLLWVRSVDDLTTALTVDPLYLQHKHESKAMDLRHWGIPLSRRFRALKLWFVIRTYGIEGLQKRIREHCRLAKLMKSKILSDERFEILGDVTMGLVCFRLIGPNTLTQKLLKMINDSGRLHMVPAMMNEHYIIRFALCTENACDEDVFYAWNVIKTTATELLYSIQHCSGNKTERILETCGDDDTFDDKIIFDNQRHHLQRAKNSRSLFFRMVSDPKCYHPRVLKSLNRQVSSQDSSDIPGNQSTEDNDNKNYKNGCEEKENLVKNDKKMNGRIEGSDSDCKKSSLFKEELQDNQIEKTDQSLESEKDLADHDSSLAKETENPEVKPVRKGKERLRIFNSLRTYNGDDDDCDDDIYVDERVLKLIFDNAVRKDESEFQKEKASFDETNRESNEILLNA